jgi:alpha-glucosidase
MFGDALLVAPILAEGQAHRSIYLPRGKWIDYFRGQQYEGHQMVTYSVDPDTWKDIPLFIRQGAIIPSQDVQQYVGERPVSRVYVDVFPASEETTFTYYDDDGLTYAYEKGAYYKQQFSTRDEGAQVRLNAAMPAGTYKPALHEYEVRLHGVLARSLTIDGSETRRYADLPQLESQAAEGWTVGSDRFGDVTCVKVMAGGAKIILAAR